MGLGKKIGIGIAAVTVVLGLGIAITIAAVSEDRPTGTTGAPADELASKTEAAVNLEAWKRTGAVEWTFGGRRRHLWDRTRGYTRMTKGELTVWLDLTSKKGAAVEGGKPLSGDALKTALEDCWAAWVNDAFWLNPVAKLRDDGVTLSVVERDGKPALLASYGSGGLTPGDAYLWILGEDGKPTRWLMWTSNIPVGGTPSSWGGWTELPTGAWISTQHSLGPATLELGDVKAAATLSELYSDDPFAPLIPAL